MIVLPLFRLILSGLRFCYCFHFCYFYLVILLFSSLRSVAAITKLAVCGGGGDSGGVFAVYFCCCSLLMLSLFTHCLFLVRPTATGRTHDTETRPNHHEKTKDTSTTINSKILQRACFVKALPLTTLGSSTRGQVKGFQAPKNLQLWAPFLRTSKVDLKQRIFNLFYAASPSLLPICELIEILATSFSTPNLGFLLVYPDYGYLHRVC